MKTFIFVVVAFLASCLALQAPNDEFRKKLQGPPSGFAQHRIPQPEMAALNSESSWHELIFTKASDGTFVWKGEVIVDSQVELDISVFSPYEDNLDIIVQPPDELPISFNVALQTSALWAERAAMGIGIEYDPPFTKRSGPFGIDGASYPVSTYTFTNPKIGSWGAALIIKDVESVPTDSPAAIVMITNKNGVKLFSHLNQYELEVGQEVGLVANLHNDQSDAYLKGRPAVLKLAGTPSASMSVRFPDGRQVQVPMHDDGVHADFEAEDGIYGAVFEALAPGQYTAQSVFKGVTEDGIAFERTTEHSFHVIDPSISLTGLADVEYSVDDKFFYFHLDVDDYPNAEETTVKAYAEVWGTDSTGYEYAPVAWMQSMVDPKVNPTTGDRVITLQLHEDWVHKAGVTAPFQLRNVWIQDRNWNVVLSERSAIYVDSSALKNFKLNPMRATAEVTEEMTFGPRPASMLRTNLSADEAKGTLLLVHGYCAGENEFPVSDFTNAVQFKDLKQVRSNDEFALKIREFGNSYPAFSIVAHSQGGLASTHLHAYYWSNLEKSKSGRLIQSVGSPYYGSGLAGNLAAIGTVFGIGCGKNNDLTYAGASTWAAGIPESVAKDVYYYTTQYKDSLLSGYCVFGASLALYSPNDGTTELVKAKLAGANDAGHTQDWCHTTGMNYPNQCTDPKRNAEMNAKAAR